MLTVPAFFQPKCVLPGYDSYFCCRKAALGDRRDWVDIGKWTANCNNRPKEAAQADKSPQ